MNNIKILIDYLNPKKHQGKIVGREEFHLIKIDETFLNENQDLNSVNVTKVILHETPKLYSFTDNFKYISTDYPLYVDDVNNEIKYYFQRTQENSVDYVSLEDVLLSNTNDTHFQVLDDQNFQQVELGLYYYHIEQRCLYIGVTVMPETQIFAHKTLDYNPKELGGLKNGTHEVDYKDAKGYTNDLLDKWFTSYFDQQKRNIKITLNPQIGKVYWYPDITIQGNKVTLFYDYPCRENEDFDALKHEYAIKIEFEDIEGFLGFMVVTYFLKGVSPLRVTGDIDTRKDIFFVDYVRIINILLKESKTNIDQALTYLHYIPADFFIEKQNLFLKMNDPDNILGAQFIWDTIGIALEDPLTNFGTNREDIVLRLLKILKYIQKDEEATLAEKNDFILNQLLTKKTSDGISYLQALYRKMNGENFVSYNKYIYKLWKKSSFTNPANPVFKDTSPIPNEDETNNEKIDKNKPRIVFPYKTNKLLGFYSSNINTNNFNDKGNIIITPDESWLDEITTVLIGKGMGDFVKQFTEEDWKAEYHPLQPIYLADPTNDKAMELQRLSPMLLLKANEDKSFWSNVITTAEYGFDALTTLSGIGNIAKFRHLARAVQVARNIKKGKKVIWYYKASKVIKGTAAAVEITSGTVNALLKITGIKDSKFGAALSEYLFWLELLSLSGEFTQAIEQGLRRNAKALTKTENLKLLDNSLDDLVKKGELDEVGKFRVIEELYKISDSSFDYSARFARQVNKSLDKTTQKIKSFEQKIKRYDYEDGKLVNNSKKIEIVHSGKKYPDFIDWNYIENTKFKGSVLTHNHPSGSGLSLADIKMFLFTGLRELRAVTPENTIFSIKNIKIDTDKSLKLLEFIKKETKSVNNIYGDVDTVFKDALVFRKVWDEIKDLVEYVKYTD